MRSPKEIFLVSLIWCMLLTTSSGEAQIIWYVDDDCTPPGTGTEIDPFCTIQQGVDAAEDRDTILVRPGTYTGEGNRDISMFGKTVRLKSTEGPSVTVLDIQGEPSAIHRGFFLIHGESPQTVIEGFMIKNGYLIGDTGGSGSQGGGGGAAIYIRDGSPTIRNCILKDNISASLGQPFIVDGRGAAIYIDGNSNPAIESSVIIDNISDMRGGGIYVGFFDSSVIIMNCLIAENSGLNGGGIHVAGSTTVIVNTLIIKNSAGFGGGIENEQGQSFLKNCMVWENQSVGIGTGQQIFIQGSLVGVSYSNVQAALAGVDGCCNYEIDWGPGMIDADPLFFDPDNGDYHVLHGSPVIDAGNNLAVPEDVERDLDGNPRFVDDPNVPDTGNPDGVNPLVDMGAYEFQPEDCNHNGTPDAEDLAEGSSEDCDGNLIPDECEALTCVDLDGDNVVGITDLLVLLTAWGPCPGCCDADFDGDDDVGINDVLELLAGWGACP